jgi:hypothetical protein
LVEGGDYFALTAQSPRTSLIPVVTSTRKELAKRGLPVANPYVRERDLEWEELYDRAARQAIWGERGRGKRDALRIEIGGYDFIVTPIHSYVTLSEGLFHAVGTIIRHTPGPQADDVCLYTIDQDVNYASPPELTFNYHKTGEYMPVVRLALNILATVVTLGAFHSVASTAVNEADAMLSGGHKHVITEIVRRVARLLRTEYGWFDLDRVRRKQFPKKAGTDSRNPSAPALRHYPSM